jgi:hypothetical protein
MLRFSQPQNRASAELLSMVGLVFVRGNGRAITSSWSALKRVNQLWSLDFVLDTTFQGPVFSGKTQGVYVDVGAMKPFRRFRHALLLRLGMARDPRETGFAALQQTRRSPASGITFSGALSSQKTPERFLLARWRIRGHSFAISTVLGCLLREGSASFILLTA